MKFSYIALNNENKKLSGFINADSEDLARAELNNLGLALISIEQSDVEAVPEKDKLKFEGLDKNGKKVVGTIPEIDLKKAFIRLTEEYGFQVTALYTLNAKEDEIINSLATVTKLKAEYEDSKADLEAPNILSKEEESAKHQLQTEVDFVIKKIEEITTMFGDEIKPGDVKEIIQIRDRLIRLKSSNNLNYIKQTCEELLKKVQDKEIYLRQDSFVREREKIKLETQKLMMDVSRINTTPVENVLSAPIFSKKESKSKVQENPLKINIRETNKEIFDYVRIYFTSDKSMRPEIVMKIKELYAKRKELITELKENNKETSKPKGTPHLESELRHVSGMLLCFYLIYYFSRFYIETKSHALSPMLSTPFALYSSGILRYVILPTLLIHITLQFKKLYFNDSKFYHLITYPLLLICLTLINLNL